ncbi:MAG TPA: hypothetical protein DCM49_01325 [Lachnospiraceae bacterium]|nr:hypothetical protein [Lachnospiraceae bacterium]
MTKLNKKRKSKNQRICRKINGISSLRIKGNHADSGLKEQRRMSVRGLGYFMGNCECQKSGLKSDLCEKNENIRKR